MRLIQVTVLFMLTGWLFFLIRGREEEPYTSIYFIWDKGKDALLVKCVLILMDVKYRWIVKPVYYFCLIRLLWEIANPFTDLEINHPDIITGLFTIIATGVALLLLKDLILRWKQKQ